MRFSLMEPGGGQDRTCIRPPPLKNRRFVCTRSEAYPWMSGQRDLRGAFREGEMDCGNSARVERDNKKLSGLDMGARGPRCHNCSAETARRTCVAFTAGMMAGGRVVTVVTGIGSVGGRIGRAGVLGCQHGPVIVGGGRQLRQCHRTGCGIERCAQQGCRRRIALQGHSQQHEPYEQRFEQEYHGGDSSTRKNDGGFASPIRFQQSEAAQPARTCALTNCVVAAQLIRPL
ncbi:MAG: hypothetical protein JWR40_2317 [Massilia sp.]|jgi:hypothetical protein|nr:hypothetical protein [Massilia sp.]MDB5950074.1 hypothetical protein [Massilia sp.]